MHFDKKGSTTKALTDLYRALLLPRMIEEKMLLSLRQGKVSKWFSGIGQEAIAVGATKALQNDEYILPMHRNLGVFTSRDVPLGHLFSQFKGKMDGFTQGRDRSFHFGSRKHHIIGMISHLGAQLGVADGVALARKLNGEGKVTLVFSGDAGASEGDFHEALNVAAVWDLPVIFLIENNGYGLSTPSEEQFKFKQFVDKGPGYGIETVQVDGNNILDVYHTLSNVAASIRKRPHPVLVEALTFRMRGHEEASGNKYVPKDLLDQWAKKDPVSNYEEFLLKEGLLSAKTIAQARKEMAGWIEQGLQQATEAAPPQADADTELRDVYFPYLEKPVIPGKATLKKRFVDAIADGLKESMLKFPQLVLMGQDIADYGGVFKVTEGFTALFGKDRVRNTPLCESAIIGMGLGMSVMGKKTMIEMQFADFVTCGFNQIVNNLAKSHYRWGQHADVVIRMPTGAGVGAGPFHSQSNEAWFFHIPGLKIFYPSNPIDAKGLLCAALEDPNPVLFFEHKYLYRSLTDEVPEGYYTVEAGKAQVVTAGTNLSIITYGMGVHWAQEALKQLEISGDVIDLRTLMPWDKGTVKESVMKTGRVLVLHEDTLTGGIGAEIAAWIAENCFDYLDAPVMREASLDTPVPFSSVLEANFLPQGRLAEKIKKLTGF